MEEFINYLRKHETALKVVFDTLDENRDGVHGNCNWSGLFFRAKFLSSFRKIMYIRDNERL